MKLRNKRNKKLIPIHQEFVNKYVCTKYNSYGIYGGVYFCEDENIAIVRRIEDYNCSEAWGCVNMSHQLLVPFEYKKIWDYGRFLISKNSEGMFVYNKKGNMLYEIERVERTNHQAYIKLYDSIQIGFRLSVRKMAISKSLYKNLHILNNGLVLLQNLDNKVGIILFSKLKLPFEYKAIAIPQNGYTLAIKESSSKSGNEILYDCLLLKVKSQIKKEGSIHPTGIYLLQRKKWEEITCFFDDNMNVEKECNSIICYNEKVKFDVVQLRFFPFNLGLPYIQEYEEEETEDDEMDDYNPWSNYSYEESMYDALGGEMDAIWNID